MESQMEFQSAAEFIVDNFDQIQPHIYITQIYGNKDKMEIDIDEELIKKAKFQVSEDKGSSFSKCLTQMAQYYVQNYKRMKPFVIDYAKKVGKIECVNC